MHLPGNAAELQRAVAQGGRFKYLFFWGHRQNQPEVVNKSCFSQWFPAAFTVDEQRYNSAEHYMMAEKARLFHDHETRAKILTAPHPKLAKQLGRQVRGFDEATWQAACFEIVVCGNYAKFSQNRALGDFLKLTGQRILVEASPVDAVWGIGLAHDHPHAIDPLQWKGQNLLGFALMDVREQL